MARFILVLKLLKGTRQDIVITRCSAAALSCDIGSEDGDLFSPCRSSRCVSDVFDNDGNGE